eukprot:151894-Amphidinium_carterae.1
MTDDPTNVGVVFTTDRSTALQHRMNSLADTMFAVLKQHSLVNHQSLMAQRVLSSDGLHAEVKLHATLMNTKYSRVDRRDGGGERQNFDASTLLERFGQVSERNKRPPRARPPTKDNKLKSRPKTPTTNCKTIGN